ncbi:hypothetical protein [Campylobacter sp. 19-13652]|uniref:hypothetical protein n=1 Tax=Campylobacter sp. 19-13652 TaxID=2840180 RepID=UPI001C74AE94|nr:hypothetical protein [Campylobacter sp. 19-13652]BCX78565.1 hypothetical protein LBC_00270 [Campylobacter sp. 19-13652]
MNYNEQNRGFVCFVYCLIQTRALWVLIMLIMLNFALATLGVFGVSAHEVAESLGFMNPYLPYLPGALPIDTDDGLGFSLQAAKAGVIVAAFLVAAFGALVITLSPKIFIIKLAGFFTILGALFVATERLGAQKCALAYASASAMFMVFVLLISWFVYNARSSEINEL